MNISVDLDSTLAYYDKWRGFDHIGEPIMPMVEIIKKQLSLGDKVKIFTARADFDNPQMEGVTKEQVFAPIEAWCEKHLGQKLEITCKKSFDTDIFIDDRAMQVIPNQGLILFDLYDKSINEYKHLLSAYEMLLESHKELKYRIESLEK